MKQKTPMSSLVNIITVILIVGAVAWGVVKISSQLGQTKSDTEQQVDDGESEPVDAAPEAKATDAPVVEKEHAAAENVEEAAAEVEEETEADASPQDQTDEPDQTQEQDKPTAETVEKPQQPFNMRQMWADLNLTDTEKARLAQGFGLAMQKWQNMSVEERQVETARLQAMRARWEGMSPDEQQETMQRMRGRFDQWRQSGSIELPELSLD